MASDPPIKSAADAIALENGKPDCRNISHLEQSHLHGRTGPSEPQLASPFTKNARRTIISNAKTLMKAREEVDKAVLRESERDLAGLTAKDWLLREEILRLSEKLAKQERRHIQLSTEELEERERLYKCDPSTERAVDLDLVRTLLWKFKRNLGPYLSDRERPFQPGENDGDSNSSSVFDTSSGGEERDAVFDCDSDDSSDEVDAEDDDSRLQLSKNKIAKDKQEQQKKVKKEQTGDDKQATYTPPTSPSQPDEPTAPKPSVQEMEAESTRKCAAIDNMSLSNNTKADAIIKEGETPVIKVNGITAEDATATQAEPIIEPWFKRYAKAMVDPNFNDFVYYRPRRSKRPAKDYFVSGALPAPRRNVLRRGYLPTPPDSDRAEDTDQAPKKRGLSALKIRADKPRKKLRLPVSEP